MRNGLFKVSDTSSVEDAPVSEDLKSKEKRLPSRTPEPITGEPSYIQEISTLIAEASGGELVK